MLDLNTDTIPSMELEPIGAPLDRAIRSCGPAGRDLSIVELVLLACDVTEDEGEVNDVVDGLIRCGVARVLPAADDPMLARRESAQELAA